jgi:hypothetical protein
MNNLLDATPCAGKKSPNRMSLRNPNDVSSSIADQPYVAQYKTALAH